MRIEYLDDPTGGPAVRLQRVTVLQGEVHVGMDPGLELSTVLGSCVATCLYDPVARIGGMNHFLLAEPPSREKKVEFDEHYGVFLMELLVNEMLKLGASKQRLRARLYGGAAMQLSGTPIGSVNAQFARDFLAREKIELGLTDLGGMVARRVHFRPASGQVRCRTTSTEAVPKAKPLSRPAIAHGDVELF